MDGQRMTFSFHSAAPRERGMEGNFLRSGSGDTSGWDSGTSLPISFRETTPPEHSLWIRAISPTGSVTRSATPPDFPFSIHSAALGNVEWKEISYVAEVVTLPAGAVAPAFRFHSGKRRPRAISPTGSVTRSATPPDFPFSVHPSISPRVGWMDGRKTTTSRHKKKRPD